MGGWVSVGWGGAMECPPGVADKEHQDRFGESMSTGDHEGWQNS